jgi:membrane protein YdbS with pleckstrin-like domain
MAMNALNPRIRVIWVVRSLIGALILGGAAGGIAVYRSASLTIPAGLTVLFVALGVGHAILRYRSWQYVVGDDALYLERGVLTQVRTEVPLVRIQHVDSRRSAVERLVGLASTVVYTAGSRGADVTIPGLTPDDASDLRQRLKGLAIDADGEDAV